MTHNAPSSSPPLFPLCSHFFTTSLLSGLYLEGVPHISLQTSSCDKQRAGSYYPNNMSPSILPFFLLYFNLLSIICPLPFSLSESFSSAADVEFPDFCWHQTAVLFLPLPPTGLHRMTGALVEVLLWLLALAVSQGAPSACLSFLSVPGPQLPPPPYLTKLLSARGPHVSGPGPLFKTQVLSRRHCSSNSEGVMKREGVGSYSGVRKDTEKGWTRRSEGIKQKHPKRKAP